MNNNLYDEVRFENFREMINYSARQYNTSTAFQIKKSNDDYAHITYGELKKRYYALCNHFINKGLQGKSIAVIGANSFEWVLAYLSAATVGCVVPLDKELHMDDVKEFMESANCAAICYGDVYDKKLKNSMDDAMELISFSSIMNNSNPNEKIDEGPVDSIEIVKDKTQILIFTSGTTGSSKGVCLSQWNICSNIYSTVRAVNIKTSDITMSILPLHHTYECTLNCLLFLSKGGKITYSDGPMKMLSNVNEYHPSVLLVVPALLQILSKRISNMVAKQCPRKYREAFKNESLAEAMGKVPFLLRMLISYRVKKALGGNLRLFIVGAAKLDVSLVDDFASIGIRTLQGYGLTECSPLLAGNNDFYFNAASTGIAMPGVEIKIDNPNGEGVGEILARGENIMLGYFNDDEANEAAFRDGWFCTGDLGKMDTDGALYIRGRLKNVIVIENGKNVYPEEIEKRLSQYAEIGEALILEHKNQTGICVKAKVFPNNDYIQEKLGHIPGEEEIKNIIQKIIKDANNRLPKYKHVKLFEVINQAFEKTTTQKIKRYGANMS